MVTTLIDNRVVRIPKMRVLDGALWMPRAELPDLASTSREDGDGLEAFVRGDEINVSALWRHRHRPVLSDDVGEVWALGASARERASALESLEAPDFTLPDLDGEPHSLSDYRGKKVFLASWSSW